MLQLNYREVAQTNIDKFEELGAFHGYKTCNYHYFDTLDGEDWGDDPKFHCAIGVCDTKDRVLAEDNECSVRRLASDGLLEADNLERLSFIQALHDYHAGADVWEDSPYGFIGRCTMQVLWPDGWDKPPSYKPIDPEHRIPIPECVADLVAPIKLAKDITPELYKEIMRRIAAEPIAT